MQAVRNPEYPLHGCVTLLSVHEVIVAHDVHDHGDLAGDPRLDHNTLDGSFTQYFLDRHFRTFLSRDVGNNTGSLL